MKSFVLPGLTRAQLQQLQVAEVQFFDWTDGGILIDNEAQLAHALKVLNATFEEKATEFQGVVELEIRYLDTTVQTDVTDKARAVSRANYIKACAERLKQFVDTARKTYAVKTKALPAAETAFMKATREATFCKVDETDEQMTSRFADEMKRLAETPKVARVRVINNAVLVYTETLFATAPGTEDKYELGRFLIRIQPDGSNDGVRFYNGSRRVNAQREAMNAPYVFADGTIMVDEVKQTFLDLIARCDYASLGDLTIQFLETVNDDLAGRMIKCWPRASKQ